MKFRTLVAAFAAAATITAGGSAISPVSADAANHFHIVYAHHVDPVRVGVAVAGADHSSRGEFVKSAVHRVFKAIHGRYSVVIANLSEQPDPFDLNHIHLFGQATYGYVQYGVWIFSSGTFHHPGDGGYINWGWWGYCHWSSKSHHAITCHKR